MSFADNNKRTVKFVFLTLFFGVISGSILSIALGFILPDGVIRDFFTLLGLLIRQGYSGLAMEILRIPLNRLCVRALYREASLKGFR